MLVLFDIDGTLLTSHGWGRRCMDASLLELFGVADGTRGVDFAGRLDSLIFRDACAQAGLQPSADDEARFRAGYARRLAAVFRDDAAARPAVHPGVGDLLAALGRAGGVDLGLLTGNYPETGRLKVDAAGLDPGAFVASAWGCDADSRPGLVPVALQRLARATGRVVSGRDVVIVGDTPHDVGCARAHGCRSLAVATGFTPGDELAACGADRVVPTLDDTAGLLSWLGL